jgi:hypothetical protein
VTCRPSAIPFASIATLATIFGVRRVVDTEVQHDEGCLGADPPGGANIDVRRGYELPALLGVQGMHDIDTRKRVLWSGERPCTHRAHRSQCYC